MTVEVSKLSSIGSDGWLVGAEIIASPNRDARPPGMMVRLVVIHAISLPPGHFAGNAVMDFFTNVLDRAQHPYFSGIADHRVSAHFFIRRSGQVIQFVSCLERAWHAGVSCWHGRERCNDFSVGIEMEGDDATPYEDAQYHALLHILDQLRQRYPIEAIVGHADVAPARKTDPGPCFDWTRIAR